MLGCVEYVCRNQDVLDDAIRSALHDTQIRADDLEFVAAVRGWSEIVGVGSDAAYQKRFEETAAFFGPERLEQGKSVSSRLIQRLAQRAAENN